MTYKNLSTDAEHGGGIIRSSVEVFVMNMERRDNVKLSFYLIQLK